MDAQTSGQTVRARLAVIKQTLKSKRSFARLSSTPLIDQHVPPVPQMPTMVPAIETGIISQYAHQRLQTPRVRVGMNRSTFNERPLLVTEEDFQDNQHTRGGRSGTKGQRMGHVSNSALTPDGAVHQAKDLFGEELASWRSRVSVAQYRSGATSPDIPDVPSLILPPRRKPYPTPPVSPLRPSRRLEHLRTPALRPVSLLRASSQRTICGNVTPPPTCEPFPNLASPSTPGLTPGSTKSSTRTPDLHTPRSGLPSMRPLPPTPDVHRQPRQAHVLMSPHSLVIPPYRARGPKTSSCPAPGPPPLFPPPRLSDEFIMNQIRLISRSLNQSARLEDFDDIFKGEDLLSEDELRECLQEPREF